MMKKNKIYLLLFSLLLLCSFTTLHKFYVSVTQIDYNTKKERIEISSRIFIDDFEKVLEKKYNQSVNLATKIEAKNAKALIEKYYLEKVEVFVNNQKEKLVFLGSEYEDDVLICYLKIDYSGKITTFEVYNNLLTEFFAEQQNIVHLNINKEKKSFLLTIKDKTAKTEY